MPRKTGKRKEENPKETFSPKDLPEIQKLREGLEAGVDFLHSKLMELKEEDCLTDPNDVVKWLKESFNLAQNVLSFHQLLEGKKPEEQEETARGGARINKFELP